MEFSSCKGSVIGPPSSFRTVAISCDGESRENDAAHCRTQPASLSIAAPWAAMVLMFPLAAPGQSGIDAIFRDSYIIDGLLHHTEQRDKSCRRDCASKWVPLTDMVRRTGVHIGTITVSREVERVRRIRDMLHRDPNGVAILTFNDLWAAREERKVRLHPLHPDGAHDLRQSRRPCTTGSRRVCASCSSPTAVVCRSLLCGRRTSSPVVRMSPTRV